MTGEHRVAISPTDLDDLRRIFDAKDPPVAHNRIAFHWSEADNRWECYCTSESVELETLVAHYAVDGGGWTEV